MLLHFSVTEVPVPWFTDIIYETIKSFRFLKTYLSHYDVMLYITLDNILKHTIIKYISYKSHYA